MSPNVKKVSVGEEKEGEYSAHCLEFPGAIRQGETKKETLTNIREALEGYLKAFP